MLGQILIGLHLAKLENRGLWIATHRPHLLGKAVGLRKIGCLCRTVGHKGAATVLPNHQSQAFQLL